MEYYSVTKKYKILLFAGKWMELENIILRPKATCSPSFADCRPKSSAAMLWDTGHTKGRP
jgi:hypothetical protein